MTHAGNRDWSSKPYGRYFKNLSWPNTPDGRKAVKDFNAKVLVENVKALGGLALTCDVQSQWYSHYPSSYGIQHPALKGRDIVGELVRECHQENIRFIAYLPSVTMKNVAEEHIDWIQKNAYGQPVFFIADLEKCKHYVELLIELETRNV